MARDEQAATHGPSEVTLAGDAVAEALLAAGVDTGFTVPGESFLAVLDAFRRRQDRFRMVSTRHEGGAAFAANAFARLSSRPAAVFVSRGPGAANAAIGVHEAMQASTPLLLLVGDVRRRSRGRESFQEIDQHQVFGAIAKAVLEPAEIDDIPRVVHEAVEIAVSDRPGPVVLVLPRDVTEHAFNGSGTFAVPRPPSVSRAAEAIGAAARAISDAQRPLIIAGEMVAYEQATDALVALAERAEAPVFASYRQPDVFPNDHAAYAGHLEINRARYQQDAFETTDLLIAAGSRLDGITTADYTLVRDDLPLVHVYPAGAVLDRSHADVPLAGSTRATLDSLTSTIETGGAERLAWRGDLRAAYLALSAPVGDEACGEIDLAQVAHSLNTLVDGGAVVLADGGSFARWVHRFLRFRHPGSYAGPVSGAMGYGVPGAIGARLARPDAPVIAFVGDGGFMMTGLELATAASEQIDCVIVVCDNEAQGSILNSQNERFGAGADFGTKLPSPDFIALANAHGIRGQRVQRTVEFAPALQRALDEPGPSLLHLVLDQRDIIPFAEGPDAV